MGGIRVEVCQLYLDQAYRGLRIEPDMYESELCMCFKGLVLFGMADASHLMPCVST